MERLLAFLANLGSTVWTFLTRPPAPTAPVTTVATSTSPAAPDVPATLSRLILSQTESLGPMPGTGGVIHAVDSATAATIASLIVKNAAAYRIPVSFLASTLRSESDFDPAALDPNDQDAVKGETPAQAIEHYDVGEAQGDIAAVRANPMFAGMTDPEIEQKLLDPAVGVELCAQIVAANLAWAKAAFVADPSLAGEVPNGDYRVAGAQAYNAGQNGTLTAARAKGLAANWAYGLGVVKRADGWASLLDVA